MEDMSSFYKFKAQLLKELKDLITPLIDAINKNTESRCTPVQLSLPFDELVGQPTEEPKVEQQEEVVETKIEEDAPVDGNGLYIQMKIKELIEEDSKTQCIDKGLLALMTTRKNNHISSYKGYYRVRFSVFGYEFCCKNFETLQQAIEFRDRFVNALGDVIYQHRSVLVESLEYGKCGYTKSFIKNWLEILHHQDKQEVQVNE